MTASVHCPECSARYRHPGRALRTRCKKCNAEIVIEAPEGMAATSAMDPPSAAPVIKPSAAPVIKPSAAPVIKPSAAPVIKPSAAPVIKPSAAPVIKPSAAPVVKPSAAPVIKPSAAPVADGSAAGARAAPVVTRSTAVRAKSASAPVPAAPSGADEDGEVAPGEVRRTSSRRSRAAAGTPPARNVGLLYASGGGVFLMIALALIWMLGGFTTKTKPLPPTQQPQGAQRPVEPVVPDPLPGFTGTGIDTPGTSASSGAPDPAGSPKPAPTPTGPVEVSPKVTPAPAGVPAATQLSPGRYGKRWNDLPAFEMVTGTSPEERTALEALVNQAVDLDSGRDGLRAFDELKGKGKSAIPVVLNHLFRLQTDQDERANLQGRTLHELLQELTGEKRDQVWPTAPDEQSGYYRSSRRLEWFRWWTDNAEKFTGRRTVEDQD